MNRVSYNAIAKDWDAACSALFDYEPAFLERLLLGLQPPAKILDLGCGTGRPITEMALSTIPAGMRRPTARTLTARRRNDLLGVGAFL
jgi:hypothetical protein